MKKYGILLLALALLLLTGCGKANGAAVERTMPQAEQEVGAPVEEEIDLDLTLYHDAEEAYGELRHLNQDPTGYLGMTLRVSGVFSSYESHGRAFYYCGLRDEDGCVENLELTFAGGSLPEDFPPPGEDVTVTGRVSSYTVDRSGEPFVCAVLEDARLD